MKILYYFGNDQTQMRMWQKHHIIDELAYHNILVDEFNPWSFETVEQANEECIKLIADHDYDAFMTVHGSNELYDTTLDYIKRRSIPRIALAFDNLLDPKRFLKNSHLFDIVALLNNDSSRIYEKYKCKTVFIPYAANPYFFKDLRTKSNSNICFVGTPYGSRCIPINVLTRNEIPVYLFANNETIAKQMKIGHGMSFQSRISSSMKMLQSASGKKVLFAAMLTKIRKAEILDKNEQLIINSAVDLASMNSIYSNYAMCLSMPEVRNTGILKHPVDIVRLRNFEIPMCAGLQLTRYNEELSHYFTPDKEIVFYNSLEELIDKVKFYSNSNNGCIVDKMKSSARYRAENEHTWYCRFRKVFSNISISI